MSMHKRERITEKSEIIIRSKKRNKTQPGIEEMLRKGIIDTILECYEEQMSVKRTSAILGVSESYIEKVIDVFTEPIRIQRFHKHTLQSVIDLYQEDINSIKQTVKSRRKRHHPQKFKNIFGQYLLENMLKHTMTAQDVADKLDLRKDSIHSYIKAQRIPNKKSAQKIFRLFKSNYNSVIDLHDRKEDNSKYSIADIQRSYRQIFALYLNIELAKTELKPKHILAELNIRRQVFHDYKHTRYLPEISMQKKIFNLFNSSYETVEDLVRDFFN